MDDKTVVRGVDELGMVHLPRFMRQALGLYEDGDKVLITLEDGRIIIRRGGETT